MGRVPKKSFPDAVTAAFKTGMPYGHDQRQRRVKHSPGMLYSLSENPQNRQFLEEMAAWLETQGIKKVEPLAMGAERAVFRDNDRVVKVGINGSRAVGGDDYVPPEGVWGVTPWLANAQIGPYRMEIQPRVELYDPGMSGTVRRKPGGADIRALQQALELQGWRWDDTHLGNLGFVPGKGYQPTVIDGPVLPSSAPMIRDDGPPVPPGTVPVPFVPPSRPAWLASLAAMTGAGAASTAKAGETETREGEMPQPNKTLNPMPGAYSATDPGLNPMPGMYSGADPSLIAYLKQMQETLPNVSDVSSAVLARPVTDMLGVSAPLSGYSRDFPEMQAYEERARAVWNTPSIRVGENVISPSDYFIAQIKANSGLDDIGPEFEQKLKDTGFQNLTDLTQGSLSDNVRVVLDALRNQGVGGTEELFPGQTPEQQSERGEYEFPQDKRYVTSENMEKNLLATRAYNMLTAMRDEPEYRPDFASTSSGVFGRIGTLLNPLPLGFDGDPASDTQMLANARMSGGLGGKNPLQSRAIEANYWDKLAEESLQRNVYRDSMKGGLWPFASRTTGQGYMRQEEDYANQQSYNDDFLIPHTLLGTETTGDRGALIRSMAANARREVPIVPSFPGDPAKQAIAEDDVKEMREGIGNYLQDQIMRGAQDGPIKQREMAKTGVPIKEFTYPTGFQDWVSKAPAYWPDTTTLATFGVGAPKAILNSAWKSIPKAMAMDFVTDQPADAGTTFAQHSLVQGSPLDFFKPMKYVGVKDAEGNPADPNSPDYPQVLARHREEQEKLLGGLTRRASQYYGTRKPQGGSNVGRGIGTQQ